MSGYIGPQPVPQATQHREAFTATASQTSFATVGYTPQFIDVYLNGVKLAPADYTATNGSDVVLTTGAAASDILEYVAYTPFEVADQTFTGTTTTDVLTTTGAFTSLGIDDNAAATAMTLDAGGNLIVGEASTGAVVNSTGGTGAYISADGQLVVSNVSNRSIFNRKTTDGDILEFRKDGTSVGSIGTDTTFGDFYVESKITNHAGLGFKVNEVLPRRNGYIDGIDNLGSSTYRFNNLYLSGGVYLGGTGAANYLDDYEEGTFTPGISFNNLSVGVTYTAQTGRYVKVGRLITVHGFVDPSSFGSSTGAFRITGLPFTATNTADLYCTASFRTSRITYVDMFTGYVLPNTALLEMQESPASATAASVILNTDITGSGASVMFSATYTTAS